MEQKKQKPACKKEQDTKKEGEQQSVRWFGIVLIIAGFYFCATGLSGSVLPLYYEGENAMSLTVILTGIAGFIGIGMVVGGSVLFMRKRNGK